MTQSEARRPAAPAVRLVDVVDPEPLTRMGLAAALGDAPGFAAGEVRARPDELPASRRPVVAGVRTGHPADVAAVRELAGRGLVVLALLPDQSWQAWAALRSHVAGALSRGASVARLLTALRAVCSGRGYWWLEPPDVRIPSVVAALSERERELLALLAVGCSDREIAAQLVISVRTVWSHLERIRAKTGVRGRVELAMLAWHARAGATVGTHPGDDPLTPVSPRRTAGDPREARRGSAA